MAPVNLNSRERRKKGQGRDETAIGRFAFFDMNHPYDSDRKKPQSASKNPSGRRPRGPAHFASEDAAAAFTGLAPDESHYEIADLLRKIGPHLGWQPRLIHHLHLLLEWTRPQDWVPGARPIVWLSVRETADQLGVTPSQVRRNEKRLHELGAISWKDSANHRRFGERDENEAIVEAWGVDLSPAASLLPLLRQTADRVCAKRAECRNARQKLSAYKQSILAALNTAVESAALDELSAEGYRRLVLEAADGHDRANLADLKTRLQRLQAIDDDLQRQLSGRGSRRADPDDSDDGGNLPDDVSTNPVDNSDFSDDSETSASGSAPHDAPPCLPPYDTTKGTVSGNSTVAPGARRKGKAGSETRPEPFPWMDGEAPVAGVPMSAFLAMMPDAMRWRVPHRGPVWRPIVDAAGAIAADIGISRHAWGDACLDLGPEAAAIALAIVKVKHQRGIVRSPGGYFRQMTRRHATGELHLAPSVFGLLPEGWRRDGDARAEPGRTH